ncbi:D-Ala-D-Ala carboxypeptidase family metallohydrolase [Priestia megaterium]|uniref:D-Ala-D-Ala carboxypeptidase family metallohydrolase n=1 Tax=Priestia megaterium TaxID=1404 RepID=UPI0023DC8E57|nr:D-Ala-D-Ala carboxypeptidase family metallohydrolase [Priestia megaterium]MDF2056296.1 D-Ala-D-Ala carboxypeptidase family metallohydrolase [Priestia megaterium]MDF2060258.1 D-Ala-D-Ala carboxypeptidase family metallohydrolase [Priestia megaterium]
MSTVGQSNIQITADDQQARRTIGGFFRGMEAQGRRFTNRMQRFDPLIGVTNSVKNTRQTLAGLQDDFEGLGEGKTFQRITKSLNRVQNGLKTTGQVSQKSLKEMQKEIERVRSTLNELGDDQPFEEMREALAQTERQFQSFQSTTRRFRFNQIENLPDHLKSFQRELNESRRQMRQMTQEGAKSLDDLADAAVKSSVGLEKITSVTKSGKSAIKIIQDLGDSTKETQLAILGLNRNGTVKISTEETTQRLGQFKQELEDSKRKLEALRDAGDFGSYEAGMRVVEKKLADVNRAMYAASKGGQAYQRMINELGVNTSDTANQAAIAMEAYKDRFIRSVDMMNAKSNQSKKMMDILPEVSHIQRVDKFFLGIGNRLENMGKQGTAANLAISMLGKNASMKDLNDRIMLINQGLMRMNQVALGLGIALAGFTAAMFNAAKGPDIQSVFEERGKLLLEYHQQVEDRTQEIIDTWGLFEKAEVEKTKPETLMKNLQGQVEVMKNWSSNLDKLAKKGIDEGLLASLRKMGPEAAGQIQALTQMSGPELDKYVALWKEKHALARTEAETELAKLKESTVRQIKELENSLTPLGLSVENFKKTWAEALGPFVELWGKIAAKVVDGATAIGEFVNKLNELNPSISASAGMFLYLFNAISLLLAPMAIGIGRANGMKAAFSATFLIIKPFVLGFLRIAGAATVVSGALVLVGGTFIKLWKNSENLRSAVMSLWDTLKEAGSTIAAPFVKAFQMISKEVTACLNKMVGSDAQNMASFWQSLGDKIAVGINKVRDVIQPVAEKIASVVDAFVEWEGFLPVIAGLTTAFVTYQGVVIGVSAAVKAWNLVQKASVATMALMRGAMIAYTVAGGGLQGILAVVTAAQRALNLSMMMNPIGLIIAALVGLGVALVVAYKKSETFRNIVDAMGKALKDSFKATIDWFTTTLPQWVSNTVKWFGDLKDKAIGKFNELKQETINRFNEIKSFFVQWGPLMLAALTGPIGLAVYAVVKNWDSIKSATITAFNATKSFLSNVSSEIKNVVSNAASATWNYVKSQWNALKDGTVQIFNATKSFLTNLWSSLKDTVSKYASATWNYVKSQWNALKSGTINIFNAVKKFLSDLWTGLKNIATKAAQDLWNNVKNQWNALKNGTINIFNSVQKFLSDLWSGIKNNVTKLAGSAKDGVVNAWISLRNRTTEMFQNIKSKVMSIFDDIVSAAKKLPGRIGDGIKSMAGGVKKGVKSFANVLVKAMGSGLNGAIDGINWVLEKVDAPKIKKWTIPEYAKGTDGHPGGPAVLGDGKKKEAWLTPDGRMGISPATDTLYNLPAGTRVFDGNQTAKMLKGVPMYAKGIGNKLKDLGGKAVDKGQELYEHAKDKTKKGVKKAKDLALDVWDYMSDPEGLMKKVFGKFIPDLPKLGASAGDMLKGGVKKAKDSSIEFIKSKLDAFMSTSDGGGDGSTVGPGSGYGGMHPYVEAWYRKVKDKFGPTKFMGGYNNRNVRGGSSKSMHAYGRAFDIGGSAKTMSKIAEWARTHMNNLQYAIYNRRIAGPGMGSKWRKYSGVNPHTDHVHLDFMTGGGGGGKTGPSGKGAERWRSSIKKAAAQMKEKLSPSELNGIIAQIHRESKGNPNIIQDPRVRDINTRNGNPARGLLQYIPQTFKAYALKGHTNIMSGYDQLLAFFNNTRWRKDLPYGKRGWGPRGGRKYEKGGIINRVQMALMGEGNKEEVIIPLEQFKDRAIKLLMYAAEKLGFDMTDMFNSQPQALGASNFSNVQSAMTTMSNKVSPEGLKLQGNSGQVIEVVVHNHTELDGKELAKGSYKYTTEYQERDKRSKTSFQKERG